MDDKSLRQLAGWFYSSAIVALIFVLLMLTTFASWFSYPLMLFKNYTWSQAKEQGNKAVARHLGAIYKLLGFVFAVVFIGGRHDAVADAGFICAGFNIDVCFLSDNF